MFKLHNYVFIGMMGLCTLSTAVATPEIFHCPKLIVNYDNQGKLIPPSSLPAGWTFSTDHTSGTPNSTYTPPLNFVNYLTGSDAEIDCAYTDKDFDADAFTLTNKSMTYYRNPKNAPNYHWNNLGSDFWQCATDAPLSLSYCDLKHI